MADTSEDFTKEIIAGTVSEIASKVLESNVAKSLLGPAALEIGQLLGDVTGAIRFYANENLSRICSRWAEARSSERLSEPEIRRVMPLLQTASMESRGELQERWATLLNAIARGMDGTAISFGQCLAQLSPKEARFLDVLFGTMSPEWRATRELGGLVSIWVEMEMSQLSEPYDEERHGDYPSFSAECSAAVSNIIRLGILERTTRVVGRVVPLSSSSEDSEEPTAYIGNQLLTEVYTFSEYGRLFMGAVSKVPYRMDDTSAIEDL